MKDLLMNSWLFNLSWLKSAIKNFKAWTKPEVIGKIMFSHFPWSNVYTLKLFLSQRCTVQVFSVVSFSRFLKESVPQKAIPPNEQLKMTLKFILKKRS